MQDKLQELTDKLYNEGLSKGKQEGEEILAKARKQAEDIIARANAEAEAIKAAAAKEAQDMKVKTEGDLKLASTQALTATRKGIEDLVISKIADSQITSSLTSAEFVKSLITTVAKAFNPDNQEPVDIALVLPENMRKEMEKFVDSELSKLINAGVEASFSKKITGGFNIGPKDGGYFISFSDETFRSLISEYLRPLTRKFLFGE